MNNLKRQPTMVFAGEFWQGAGGAGLSDGFKQLGWRVQEIDYRHYGARAGSDISVRLASRFTRSASDAAYRKRLIADCRILRPEVFFTIKGTAITADFLDELKSYGIKTVMFYPDVDFNHLGVNENSFDHYDVFITTKTFHLPHLKKLLSNAHLAYVPHGYCQGIHEPFGSGRRTSEAVYIGSHSAFKAKWITSLLEIRPATQLCVYGNRWSSSAKSPHGLNYRVEPEILGACYAKAMEEASVNIAIHYGPTKSGWQDNVSTRTFEIPACRGFMLHIDNAEVREFFKPGEEIDVFSSPEELSDKIAYYLRSEDVRSKMLNKAYERCVPHYSYASRARAILDILLARDVC